MTIGVCDPCDRYYVPDAESGPSRICTRCSQPLRPLSLEESRAFVLDRLIRNRPRPAHQDLQIRCRRVRLRWTQLERQQESHARRAENPVVRGKARTCFS
jgi:hypothetical protein